jgi:hypothetical protein
MQVLGESLHVYNSVKSEQSLKPGTLQIPREHPAPKNMQFLPSWVQYRFGFQIRIL